MVSIIRAVGQCENAALSFIYPHRLLQDVTVTRIYINIIDIHVNDA